MHPKISRTKLARYAVEQLAAGRQDVLRELAAYLIEKGRVREADLIIREIAEQFEKRGIVSAEVTSAERIDETLRAQIAQLVGAKKLELTEMIEPKVLGGIRLETASRRLDATVTSRLSALRKSNALR